MQFNLYAIIKILNINFIPIIVVTIILVIEIHKFDIITFLKTITVCNKLTKVGNNIIYGT